MKGATICEILVSIRKSIVSAEHVVLIPCQYHPYPDTPCMPYMPTLGWFGVSMQVRLGYYRQC